MPRFSSMSLIREMAKLLESGSKPRPKPKPRGVMKVLGAYDLDMDRGGSLIRKKIDTLSDGDHGADPVGDGTFRMVPSGDIVSYEERNRRLARFAPKLR